MINTACVCVRVRVVRCCLEAQCQIITSEFSRFSEVALHHFKSGSCVSVCARTSLYSFVDQPFTRDLFCEDTLVEATKSIIKALGF